MIFQGLKTLWDCLLDLYNYAFGRRPLNPAPGSGVALNDCGGRSTAPGGAGQTVPTNYEPRQRPSGYSNLARRIRSLHYEPLGHTDAAGMWIQMAGHPAVWSSKEEARAAYRAITRGLRPPTHGELAAFATISGIPAEEICTGRGRAVRLVLTKQHGRAVDCLRKSGWEIDG